MKIVSNHLIIAIYIIVHSILNTVCYIIICLYSGDKICIYNVVIYIYIMSVYSIIVMIAPNYRACRSRRGEEEGKKFEV